MKILKTFFFTSLLSLFAFADVISQDNPVKWKFSVNYKDGNKAELVMSASIKPDYVMYAQEVPENGPLPTVITFNVSEKYKLIGNPVENPAPKTKFDEAFELDVKYHKKDVNFIQQIEILSTENVKIEGTIEYQVCSGMMCLPYDKDFSILVNVANTKYLGEGSVIDNIDDTIVESVTADGVNVDGSYANDVDNGENSNSSNDESVLWFILLAIGAGLASVLTPCVFPMIPMTISFFMSGSGKKGESFIKGLVFGLSIAVIYSLLGVIVALTKSADFANVLSTHWIANLIFFLLFITFACSFLGLFEINILTGFSNKLDAKVDKGGMLASFFMAAVLTIVSFSCTGPFVATLLVEASFGMSVWKPIGGMFAFGLAMGLPFIILSLFPALLKKMPKSGGWLNSVKVVFAFLMLALAMKFLLTIDLVYELNWFTREVYIAIWIVLCFLLGLYLQ